MLREYLYEQIDKYLASIDDKDIYAVSVLVENNEDSVFNGISGFPSVRICYNAEHNCENLSELSEERWNIAFWDICDEYAIIDYEENIDGARILYDWYIQNNIQNVGYENPESMYDEEMNYIGRGPNGYWELYEELTLAIKEIRKTGRSKNIIKRIPIIIHDYEYSWYVENFTLAANPDGQAENFLKFCESLSAD